MPESIRARKAYLCLSSLNIVRQMTEAPRSRVRRRSGEGSDWLELPSGWVLLSPSNPAAAAIRVAVPAIVLALIWPGELWIATVVDLSPAGRVIVALCGAVLASLSTVTVVIAADRAGDSCLRVNFDSGLLRGTAGTVALAEITRAFLVDVAPPPPPPPGTPPALTKTRRRSVCPMQQRSVCLVIAAPLQQPSVFVIRSADGSPLTFERARLLVAVLARSGLPTVTPLGSPFGYFWRFAFHRGLTRDQAIEHVLFPPEFADTVPEFDFREPEPEPER